MTSIDVITPPAVEPISLVEARAQCRIDQHDAAQDLRLSAFISAARDVVEKMSARALINRTVKQTMDGFPPAGEPITLYASPVSAVSSITYVDEDGTTQTLDAGDYVASITGGVSQIGHVDRVWPSTRVQPAAVSITFVAGYGSASTSVPADLRVAVAMLAAMYFEQREAVVTGTIATQLPMAVEAIINCNRSGLQM